MYNITKAVVQQQGLVLLWLLRESKGSYTVADLTLYFMNKLHLLIHCLSLLANSIDGTLLCW